MKTETLPVTVSDLRYLKGVGPKRAQALERLGIASIRDLLFFFPRRYEDRSHFALISEVQPEQTVSVRGEILSVKLKPIRRLRLIEMIVGDSSDMIHAVWFNQPYLKKTFQEGQQVILYGKVELYKNRLQISAPEYEVIESGEEAIHTGRITPIYPLTEGLFQRSLRATLHDIVETHLDREITEYLPQILLDEKKLMGLREAAREMHFPTSPEILAQARHRIVFDEFLVFQMILLRKMERLKAKYQAHTLSIGAETLQRFQATLPFKLTADQDKVLGDLLLDLNQTVPMNRLLQGDVGSGKTLVATFGLLWAAQNKLQAVLLVPTEILAEQHYKTLSKLLEPFGIPVGLLTSSTPAAKRERMLAEIKNNKLHVMVGTHALLQEDVTFHSLALVVIDEQHKFGVYQRAQLFNRNPRPHQLVMTATPIPRTLAFTTYGDLAISTIKELPSGRLPIKTYWITRKKQDKVLEHILEKIGQGEQAYFIFPLIEETEKIDLLAAEKEYQRLRLGVFKDIRVGLVHGRMTKEQRDPVMDAFRRGEIQVLVATSVIEVGVDHPNATMLVVENADRFGLAQLHQMRGRIGRGHKASECFIFGEPSTDEGRRRLRIFANTQDGFEIAEEDLKLRGFGDFLGTRQSGEPYFRVGNPIEDEALLREARQTALELMRQQALEKDPAWKGFHAHLEAIAVHY